MWHMSLLGNKILGVHCWLTATWTHSTTHWGMSWCACHIAVMLACYRRDYSCMESTKALITGNVSTANECVCCYTLLWRTASHALVVYWIYVACLHVSVFSILIRLLWSLDAGACACVHDLSILGCGTASTHELTPANVALQASTESTHTSTDTRMEALHGGLCKFIKQSRLALCTYLAHHEGKSIAINIIIFFEHDHQWLHHSIVVL